MARIFITGSSDGLRLLAGKQLARAGHTLVLHARNPARAAAAQAALAECAAVVIGDDRDALLPLLDAVEENTGEMPGEVSADNGFCSEANLEGLTERAVRGYIAAGRASKPGGGTKGGPLVQAIRTRLKRGGHQSRYRLRKFTVEPVFGHIKQARGFRQFLLRGINKVKAEGAMICTAHNLAKLTAWADAP